METRSKNGQLCNSLLHKGLAGPGPSASIAFVHVNASTFAAESRTPRSGACQRPRGSVLPSRDRSTPGDFRDLRSERGDDRLSLLRASHEQSPLIGLVQPFQELLYPVPGRGIVPASGDENQLDRLNGIEHIDPERSRDDRGVGKAEHSLRLRGGGGLVARDQVDRAAVDRCQALGQKVVVEVWLSDDFPRGGTDIELGTAPITNRTCLSEIVRTHVRSLASALRDLDIASDDFAAAIIWLLRSAYPQPILDSSAGPR